jgi:hypothetical protein
MSYFVCDGKEFLGDFASNKGIGEMRDGEGTPPLLRAFVVAGGGTEEEVREVLEEIAGMPEYEAQYNTLAKANDFPVTITDGMIEEDP